MTTTTELRTRIIEPRRRSTSPRLSWWSSTIDRWDELELDPKAMEPARSGIARAAAFGADRREAYDHATSALAELRRSLARGGVSFVECAEQYAVLQALQQVADPKDATKAALTLENDVTTAMRSVGDALIVEHLAPAYDAVITDARKLAPHVDGIADEKQAMRSSDKQRTAWGKLVYLASRRKLLRDLARRLRDEGIVSVSPYSAFEAEYEYRRPEAASAEKPDVLGLVALVRSDAEPALLTAAEVDAIEAARAEPLRVPPAPPRPIVRSDGSLIGGSR